MINQGIITILIFNQDGNRNDITNFIYYNRFPGRYYNIIEIEVTGCGITTVKSKSIKI